MRKIVVLSMISLDGVMQAPGGRQEDPSNGFKYGGWVAPYSDEEFNKVVKEELQPADYLLGRKTFGLWAGYWPQHGDFWPAINEGKKFVISRKLKKDDPLIQGWKGSELVKGIAGIRKLRAQGGRDLHVWGSSQLVHLLMKNDLVDELRIKIYPIILGKGKKLFDNKSKAAAFELKKHVVTPSGVIIAYYKRNGKVKTADVSAD